MHQAFLNINGVRTSVITYGRWVEESPKSSEPEDIVLIIPGNPGFTGFYKMFMHTLHEKTQHPVWIVGHAGHELPKNNRVDPIPPLKNNEKLFGLKGQIDHKVDFIKKYVPENARLHLVGHSIGCYIALELMKDKLIKSKVVDIDLLFPTIESMAETNNAKFLTRLKPILGLVIFLAFIFTILPTVLRNFLMYCYMKVNGVPRMHFKSLIYFVNPSILRKVFFMAFEEFEQVRDRNDAIIQENVDKIKFLYGCTDQWAPKRYYEKLKTDIPQVDAQICKFNHTFVFNESRPIGDLVGQWISAK